MSTVSRGGMTVAQVPQDDIVDLFKHCDLRTRCKIRRVSRYWKHVVSLNDVNETVLVDARAIMVSSPRPDEDAIKAALESAADADELQPADYAGHLQEGLLHLYQDSRSLRRLFVRLSDHQRNGLLGAHVRTVVYRGDEVGRKEIVNVYLKSICMYCSGVRHLVLFRCGRSPRSPRGIPYHRLRKDSYYDPSSAHLTRLPRPETITVLVSVVLFGRFCPPDGADEWLQVEVDYWRCDLDEDNAAQIVRDFVACSARQRQWVARWAPALPESYHQWTEAGFRFYCRFYWHFDSDTAKCCVNLRTADYDSLDGLLIRMLAICIRREKVHGTEEEVPSGFY